MRVDARLLRLGTALLLLAAAVDVRAQGLTGYAQGQVQVYDQFSTTTDGTVLRQRIERWTQALELQHTAMPGHDLRVMSSFRFTDLSYRGQLDQSHTPQGSLQVLHPWANFFAAYRPTTVTGGLGANGVTSVTDSVRGAQFTTRSQETLVTGQIAPPAWPRLDVSWTRRHRDRDPISAEEMAVNRMARMSWNSELLALYGSLGDQTSERAGVRVFGTQRTASLGGQLHFAPAREARVDLSYDLNDARQSGGVRLATASRGQNATLNANWRPTPLVNLNGTWLHRRSETRGPRPFASADHEGALQWSADPAGPAQFLAVAGVRTVRGANNSSGLARSLSAVASLAGHVREDWSGSASLTHVTNWEPTRGRWSVEAGRLASVMRLTRGLEVSADGQVSTNDDTTAREVNTQTEANLRARMTPWRALDAGFVARVARTGAGIGYGTLNQARTAAWDLRWRPLRNLEATGTLGRTRGQGDTENRTRSLGIRWSAHPRLQVLADWSNSTDTRSHSGVQRVSGREIGSVHVLALITRTLQLDATAGIADRGSATENRQGTATLTWAFGR